MSVLSDIYEALFGRTKLYGGNVIDMAEHGRVGGISTGQGYKYVSIAGEKTLIDEVDSTTTYIGKSKLNGNTANEEWQIKRVLVSGTLTTISFADNVDTYTKEWDERGNYSY